MATVPGSTLFRLHDQIGIPLSTSLPETLSRTGSLDLPGIIDAAVAEGRSYRKISSCLDEAIVDGEIRGRNEVARMVRRYLLQYHPVP